VAALSVHVYSPPLSSMSYYDGDGSTPLRNDAVDKEAPLWSSPSIETASGRSDTATSGTYRAATVAP
jgi:hypothetical protein